MLLSYDPLTQKPFFDQVILINHHEYGKSSLCSTVKIFFSEDKNDFMELTKHHFSLVKDEKGTYTEKKASEVEVGDVMLRVQGKDDQPTEHRAYRIEESLTELSDVTELHT